MTNQSKFKITVAVTAFLILVILIYASHNTVLLFNISGMQGVTDGRKVNTTKRKQT